MRVRLSFIGAKSRRRVSGLLEHRIPVSHRSPHHQVFIPSILDKARRVEASLMLHLHGAKVGGYIVLEPDGPSDGGLVRYAAYLRTTRPPRPPPLSPSPASASSSPSRCRFFFFPRRNGSVCLHEGVLTWSFKISQVMGGRLDERSFARVPELPEDTGDVGDDEAARRGL